MSIVKTITTTILLAAFVFYTPGSKKCNRENDHIREEPNTVESLYINQNIEGTIRKREVLLHFPDKIDPRKLYPVVFAFHGNGGVNNEWVNVFDGLVQSGEFVGIYPQGYMKSWNLGYEESKADDVRFVNSIVERLKEYPNLDMGRLYAIGFSNGAGLVNLLGIETNHFSAIAPCSTQLILGKEPNKITKPLSVYQVSGTHDRIIPFDGGPSPVRHNFLSAKESARRWAATFSCDEEPQVHFIKSDSLFIYPNCTGNHEIRFHRVEKAGHGLNQHLDSKFYERIWNFFKVH